MIIDYCDVCWNFLENCSCKEASVEDEDLMVELLDELVRLQEAVNLAYNELECCGDKSHVAWALEHLEAVVSLEGEP